MRLVFFIESSLIIFGVLVKIIARLNQFMLIFAAISEAESFIKTIWGIRVMTFGLSEHYVG
ncbi:hypothetical protein NM22_13280 [Vibrio tubiashii]|nr:hypothetical protein NM22_13280 [Vibrio tubiashii]